MNDRLQQKLPKKIRKNDRLSVKEIEELMGVNHRGLRRGKGGAWK
jgi:hypothetical protein